MLGGCSSKVRAARKASMRPETEISETSLIANPAVPFDDLKRRLYKYVQPPSLASSNAGPQAPRPVGDQDSQGARGGVLLHPHGRSDVHLLDGSPTC
eukprot:765035-Hanusia_phi.AAC.3